MMIYSKTRILKFLLFSLLYVVFCALIYLLILLPINQWINMGKEDSESSSLFAVPIPGESVYEKEKVGVKMVEIDKVGETVDLYWQLVSQQSTNDLIENLPFSQNSTWFSRPQDFDGISSNVNINDRFLEQHISSFLFMKTKPPRQPKKILLLDTFTWWHFNATESEASCPGISSKCQFLDAPQYYFSTFETLAVDAVVAARDYFHKREIPVRKDVTRLFFTLESPFHSTASLTRVNDLFASYWRGSDIVTPYGKWVYYNQSLKAQVQSRNYARGKHKLAAIFTTNCVTPNNRLEYVHQLQRHIPVDVYGGCGNLTCPRTNSDECFAKLKRHYKFYLAFENSNCRDYITEKLYENAFRNNVVPVVMGGHPDDYAAVAPYNSYIHVDDFRNPEELAKHLKDLNAHDDKYNKYFEWKGTGRFIQVDFFCRFCALLYKRGSSVPKPSKKEQFQWNRANKNLCLPRNQMHWSIPGKGEFKKKIE